jgi:hypothetical protein
MRARRPLGIQQIATNRNSGGAMQALDQDRADAEANRTAVQPHQPK